MTPATEIVLASASPYRRALLRRLGIEFRVISPDIDETPRAGESPQQLVLRLAAAKAAKASEMAPQALIIASDQVAELDGEILTKPGTRERAREQLTSVSGRRVRFLTGLCVLNAVSRQSQTDCVIIMVDFKDLDEAEISRYLDKDEPLDCASAFKSESLGIALTRAIDAPDPTALIGLPLIRLAEMLRNEGLIIP